MRSSTLVAPGRRPQTDSESRAPIEHSKQSAFKPIPNLKATAPGEVKSPSAPGKQAGPTSLHALVRQLAAEIDLRDGRSNKPGAAGSADPEDEDFFPYGSKIILNLEVDGVRCLLIKNPRPDATITATVRVCLSPREQEITRLIALGYPNKAVADILEISTWTVSTHLRRIFTKFRVSSRAAMVACFLQRNKEDAWVH